MKDFFIALLVLVIVVGVVVYAISALLGPSYQIQLEQAQALGKQADAITILGQVLQIQAETNRMALQMQNQQIQTQNLLLLAALVVIGGAFVQGLAILGLFLYYRLVRPKTQPAPVLAAVGRAALPPPPLEDQVLVTYPFPHYETRVRQQVDDPAGTGWGYR